MNVITLTDKDGLQFSVETPLIEAIRCRTYGSDIMMTDGTQIAVRESIEDICRKVVDTAQ